MSLIHIARNNAVLGQFTEDDVRTGLVAGTYLATDLAWRTGMAQWKPLGEWPEFAAPGSLPPMITEGSIPLATAAMPSWERRSELGLISAFCKTTKEVLSAPNTTFSLMQRDGGVGGPLLFLLIPHLLSGVASASVASAVMLAGGHTEMIPGPLRPLGVAAVAGYFLVSGILASVVSAFLMPAILHLFLMLYKGANSGYETTFRATTYSSGAIACICVPLNALMLIPHIGMVVLFVLGPIAIYSVVLNCIAVARAQRTDTWRVVMAVLTPGLVCCCLYMVAVFAFVGIFAATKAGHP